MSFTNLGAYAGDVSVLEAWQKVSQQGALLIDVRTHAEWSYVGIPLLGNPDRDLILIEWLSYPSMQCHADFAARLQAELDKREIAPKTALYFLCRSGFRSRDAAIEMTRQWKGPCYNIASGFEGDLDDEGKRASVNGWKFAGLPWRQY